MTRSARLNEIAAIPALAAALRCFDEEARAALTELEMQVRRAMQWVQHDQKEYWHQQLHRGWDRVNEARVELERAMWTRRVADHQPGCREEKQALDTAKRRLHKAEEKVDVVRHWSRVLDHEVTEYRGVINQLTHWLESEFPKAVAALTAMGRSLEAYVAMPTAEAIAASLPAATPPIEPEVQPPQEPVAKQESQQ